METQLVITQTLNTGEHVVLLTAPKVPRSLRSRAPGCKIANICVWLPYAHVLCSAVGKAWWLYMDRDRPIPRIMKTTIQL